MNQIYFRLIREYARAAVSSEWVPETRPRVPEIETEIDQEWEIAKKRVGIKLFDGPMCRLESYQADERLLLRVSKTSYKPFLGTNLTHPEFAERFGAGALANPIGLSAALESADGMMMLGRRSSTLAYYPSRVHPFAGALEPREKVDVFEEMLRELEEEVRLMDTNIAEMTLLGLVEDAEIRQPELVFYVKCKKTRKEIEAQMDAAEHTSVVVIDPDPIVVEAMLGDCNLTPVACAALLLWGRRQWGADWFDAASRAVTLR